MSDKGRQWSESCPLKGSQWIPIYCLFVFVMLAFLKHFSCLRSPTKISTHSQRLMNEKPRKSPKLPPNSATRDSQEWRYSLKISQSPNIWAQRGFVPDFYKDHVSRGQKVKSSKVTSVCRVVSEDAIQTLMKQTSFPKVEYLVIGKTWICICIVICIDTVSFINMKRHLLVLFGVARFETSRYVPDYFWAFCIEKVGVQLVIRPENKT